MLDESTRRLVAAEVNQELLNFHGNLKSTRQLLATGIPDIDGTGSIWPHNLHKSTAYVPHIEKVFSNVRQRYGLSPGDTMENLDVNAVIWGTVMSVTLQAAVDLGRDYSRTYVPPGISLCDH